MWRCYLKGFGGKTEFTIFFVFNLWGWDGAEYKEIVKETFSNEGSKTAGENSKSRVPGDAQVVLWVIFYSAAYAGMLKNIIKH